MPNPSADARQKNPSRRAVLKVGANAAWAVPAIQIAAATPAFAGSTDATLTPTVLNTSQSGNTLTITVQVKSTNRAATGVSVSASGADVVPGSFTVSPATAPVALNGTANFTVKVNTTGNGVVTLTPAGTTANANKNALATTTVAKATAVLAVANAGYVRTDADDYIMVNVSTTAAAATNVIVKVSGYATGNPTSQATVASLTPGTSVPLTIPVQMTSGAHTVSITADGATTNGVGAAKQGTDTLSVPNTVPANTSTAAVLSISGVTFNRNYTGAWWKPKWDATATLSFKIGSNRAAKSVAWSVVDASGKTVASNTAANIAANGTVTVPQFTLNAPHGDFTIKATGVTNGTPAYPAVPATDDETI